MGANDNLQFSDEAIDRAWNFIVATSGGDDDE